MNKDPGEGAPATRYRLRLQTGGSTKPRRPTPVSTAQRLLIPEILFPEEHAELLKWAREMEPDLKEFSPGKRLGPVARLRNRPDACRRVRHRIQEQLDIDIMIPPSGPTGLYLSVISDRGSMLPFLERAGEGKQMLRCVLLLQAATQGGLSFVGNGVVPMDQRDLLVFCASAFHQGVSTVKGHIPRISLMFGYETSAAHVVPGLDHVR